MTQVSRPTGANLSFEGGEGANSAAGYTARHLQGMYIVVIFYLEPSIEVVRTLNYNFMHVLMRLAVWVTFSRSFMLFLLIVYCHKYYEPLILFLEDNRQPKIKMCN